MAASLGPLGIRANGISAGPIKTLAASGIKDFSTILKYVETHAPLRRNVTIEDVGNVAAFLMSDLAAGVTGEITHVDGGFRSEEHTSELQSLMRIPYAVFCLKKKKSHKYHNYTAYRSRQHLN